MKKIKRGFTLIELLAVIVILAIVLVIAMPKIMNVIYESKVSSFKSSVKLAASAVEKTYQISLASGESGTLSRSGSCMDIASLDTNEYLSCTYEIDSNEKVMVTLKGTSTGKFSNMICTGNKISVNCDSKEYYEIPFTRFMDDYEVSYACNNKVYEICNSIILKIPKEYGDLTFFDMIDMNYDGTLDEGGTLYKYKDIINITTGNTIRFVNYYEDMIYFYDDDIMGLGILSDEELLDEVESYGPIATILIKDITELRFALPQ